MQDFTGTLGLELSGSYTVLLCSALLPGPGTSSEYCPHMLASGLQILLI